MQQLRVRTQVSQRSVRTSKAKETQLLSKCNIGSPQGQEGDPPDHLRFTLCDLPYKNVALEREITTPPAARAKPDEANAGVTFSVINTDGLGSIHQRA